jgi:hypothetical protein
MKCQEGPEALAEAKEKDGIAWADLQKATDTLEALTYQQERAHSKNFMMALEALNKINAYLGDKVVLKEGEIWSNNDDFSEKEAYKVIWKIGESLGHFQEIKAKAFFKEQAGDSQIFDDDSQMFDER